MPVASRSALRITQKCIGIVREVYNKWERRCPLTPDHISQLVNQHSVRVLVQPCTRRIFGDDEYARSGAELTEDLSPATTIMSVKQVPIANLLPNRTYLMFSHTIKAQDDNMLLLDAIQEKRIRLLDYECMNDNGERTGQRLVAFGRFAGLAGFTDILNGLGQQLLAKGYSTPFLSLPLTYQFPDLPAAKARISSLGQQLIREGLSAELSPIVFAFTGDGKVSQGAREMFKLLPHQWIAARDLPDFIANFSPQRCNKLYGTLVTEDCLVERLPTSQSLPLDRPVPFNRAEYREKPELYRPIFHERIAPFISVLINGLFWDHRFPRLLTRAQLRDLYRKRDMRLQAIADITCDIEGSIEFLSHPTEIEKPFVTVRPSDGQLYDGIDGQGIVLSGVDILPSELPKEATESFGDKLLPLILQLLHAEGQARADVSLPTSLQGAMITDLDGQLTERFKYIQFLRSERERERKLAQRVHDNASAAEISQSTVKLVGHLFDSGLINHLLDIIDLRGGSFHITECLVRPNRPQQRFSSTIVLEVGAEDKEALAEILRRMHSLVELTEAAAASLTVLGGVQSGSKSPDTAVIASEPSRSSSSGAQAGVTSPKRILLLGAGRVAGPALLGLASAADRRVTLVGMSHNEVEDLMRKQDESIRRQVEPVVMDVSNGDKVTRLVDQADVVVSLLPASLHPKVAELCLRAGAHLVTSSYISPELREMDAAVRDKGLIFLNEVGLDPGIDHLESMRIIDSAHGRGGQVLSYHSVCGGLPAPEVATLNPLLYKFSWSPRAALQATQNAAVYLKDGVLCKVSGKQLLTSAEADGTWPAMDLEVLPNRDSTLYAQLYGIPEARTVFRGTLRYRGWSELMHACCILGLFESTPISAASWRDQVAHLCGLEGGGSVLEHAVQHRLRAAGVLQSSRLLSALDWLGLLSPTIRPSENTVIDSFCAALAEKLGYGPGERDMVLMKIDVQISMNDDAGQVETALQKMLMPTTRTLERHISTLLVMGNEQTSAMARTVGLTTALAAELVLEEAFGGGLGLQRGVIAPLRREVYAPLLQRLEGRGLTFHRSCSAE